MSDSKAGPKATHLKCKASASLLCNNLTINENSNLAYIHRNEVHILTGFAAALTAGKPSSQALSKCIYAEKDPLTQVKYCNIGGTELLVAVTLGGLIHIYNEAGTQLLNSHKLARSQVALSVRDAHLRGIAHDGKERLFVGAGSGDIIVFGARRLNSLGKMSGHTEPVCDIDVDAKGNAMVSGDEKGTVILWERNSQGDFQQSCEFKGQGEPASVIKIHNNMAIVGYTTGHLRIYDLTTRTLSVEIAAHSRAISCIDLHAASNQIAIGSEDSHVSVWSLPSSGDSKVALKLSASLNSTLVTGIAYGGPSKSVIATTAYDSRFVSVVPRPT